MKYRKSDYHGTTCRSWNWAYLGIHLDTSGKWRRPGFSLWGSFGRQRAHHSDGVEGGTFHQRHGPGGYVDVSPPLGEPNRAGFHTGDPGWSVTLGLPSLRDLEELGKDEDGVMHVREVTRLRSLHIDGIARYHYHKDDSGEWVRNDKPEPLHWGWLTIMRRAPQ